jgi:hypothetical protein
MRPALAILAVVLLVPVLAPGSLQAISRQDPAFGIDDRWRNYLAGDADREPGVTFPFEHCFRRSAAAHGLPVTLLLAVARGESDFDPRAVSSANALGLMQIRWPLTARHLGIHRKSQLYDPCTNVDAGARYLKELLHRYQGDMHRALAAYNHGPSRVPPAGGPVPDDAIWYSAYIWRHLAYVIGDGTQGGPGAPRGNYGDERQFVMITFDAPYRAEAFVGNLQAAAPGVRLDWFREAAGRFRVVMLYNSEDEFDRGKRSLRHAGFSVPGP